MIFIIRLHFKHITSCLCSSRPLIGAEIGAFTSRLNNPPGATASSAPQRQVSQTDDDIPEWKRAMLERQAARNRDAESYSTSSTASNQGKLENEFQSTQYNLMVNSYHLLGKLYCKSTFMISWARSHSAIFF